MGGTARGPGLGSAARCVRRKKGRPFPPPGVGRLCVPARRARDSVLWPGCVRRETGRPLPPPGFGQLCVQARRARGLVLWPDAFAGKRGVRFRRPASAGCACVQARRGRGLVLWPDAFVGKQGVRFRRPASAGCACVQARRVRGLVLWPDAFAGKQGVRFATRLRPAARASAEGPGNGRRTCRAAALPAAVRPLCAAALPAATRPLCSAALPAATRPLRAAALPAATRPLRAAPSASVCPHALAALVASAKARPSVFVLLFKMFRPLLTRQSTYAMIWMAFRKAAARCTCSRIRAGITSLTRNHIFSALCPPNRIWKRIEVVITGLTRNQVVRKGSWVRIPPLPPTKVAEKDATPETLAAARVSAVSEGKIEHQPRWRCKRPFS